MNAAPIVYRINAQDRISFVNEAWRQFAEENLGEQVMPARVIGAELWPFVGDETTRELYRRMVARARNGHTVQFRYRCDAPAERRVFEMKIFRGSTGEVEFDSQIVSREPRPAVSWLDRTVARSRDFVTMCSWCGRVALATGEWVEIEQAIERHRAFQGAAAPRLTHGICEVCLEKMSRIIQRPASEGNQPA